MLLALFWSFLKIGAFTFGGGYAMIPLIQREVIQNRGWIKEQEFIELLTIAQSAPGPISLNTAVFVGYRMRGYVGAIAAILGVILPSFLIILTIVIFFQEFRHNAIVDAAFKGMRPAVVALILYPVIMLAKGLNWGYWIVIAAAAAAIWRLGWSPVLILLAAAAIGILHQLYIKYKAPKR